MKFSTREDIEAPVAFVFRALTDFEHFATRLRARGMRIDRTDGGGAVGAGTGWTADVPIRGQVRHVTSTVIQFVPDAGFEVASTTGGLDCVTLVDLTALAASRTRVHVAFEMRPTTLKGRLLIQPLRLAKASLNERFAGRVAWLADEISDRYGA